MNMIQFEIASGHGKGRQMWVNPDHVSSVDGATVSTVCYVTFAHGRAIEVTGHHEAVAQRITDAANAKVERT